MSEPVTEPEVEPEPTLEVEATPVTVARIPQYNQADGSFA